MPATIVHRLAIATHVARLAHGVVLWTNDLGAINDPHGNAALAAALAIVRRRRARNEDIEFVDAEVEGPSHRLRWVGAENDTPFAGERPLLGAGLVAAGLAAAARGDVERARAILKNTSLFDPRVFPERAQQIAWSWRAADAAARGDWSELFGWGLLERQGSRPLVFRLRTFRGVVVAAWKRDAEVLARMGVDPGLASTRYRAFSALLVARQRDMATGREDRLQGLAQRFLKRRPSRGFSRLAGVVALRLCAGKTLASRRRLDIAWALCPRRLATRPLVNFALAAEPPNPDALRDVIAPVLAIADPWERGLAAMARANLLRPGLTFRSALTPEAATAWTAGLGGDAMASRIGARAAALGTLAGDDVGRALRESAVEALVAAVLDGEVPNAAMAFAGPVSAPAFHRSRERLLDDLLALVTALDQRKRADERLPAPDEWAAFTAVLDAYQRVAELGGPSARLLAFDVAFPPVTNWAVWLHNGYGQRAIANAVYRWVLGEAHLHAKEHAAELSLRNLRASLP